MTSSSRQSLEQLKGLPKLVGFAPGAEHWPNRKAYKAEILHGGLEYPHDIVRLAKVCMKLHLKKVNFLQFFKPKFGIFDDFGRSSQIQEKAANSKAKNLMTNIIFCSQS